AAVRVTRAPWSKMKKQSRVPQLMPGTSLVTVPSLVPVLVSIRLDLTRLSNSAVQDIGPLTVMVAVGLVPAEAQSPFQPAKNESVRAAAVKTMTVIAGNGALTAQIPEQSRPGWSAVTSPRPMPSVPMPTGKLAAPSRLKVAVQVASPDIVKPALQPALQPAKNEPASAVAASMTGSPSATPA